MGKVADGTTDGLVHGKMGAVGRGPLAPALQEPDDQHEPDHDGTYDQHHRHENAAATKIAVAAARCMRIALLFLVKKSCRTCAWKYRPPNP